MSFVYLPEVVEGVSRVFTSISGEQSAMLNGIPIVKKSCKPELEMDFLVMLQSGETLKHSTGNRGVDAWILSLRGSHASRSVLQENKKELTMIETAGQTQFALLEKLSPDTVCWKTSQVSFLTNTLEPFLQSWPRAGIMQDGKCYRLLKWGRRIRGIGSGYWLTPSTIRIEGGKDRMEKRAKYRESIGRHYVAGCLAEQINNKKLWPTVSVKGNYNRKGLSKTSGDGLVTAVKQWPTPREFCYKDSVIDRNKGNLGEKVKGQLNPDWVEWLMGWPIGWSSIEPLRKLNILAWESDPGDGGNIPRVTTRKENRTNRLKALGNGQVPQCAFMVWEILKGG